MGNEEHGALGSNQPLERVLPVAAEKDENVEIFAGEPEGDPDKNAEKQEVLPLTTQILGDDDVVYLREDLRRR